MDLTQDDVIKEKIESKEIQDFLKLLCEKLRENNDVNIEKGNLSEPEVEIYINNHKFLCKEDIPLEFITREFVKPNKVISSKKINYCSIYNDEEKIFTMNKKLEYNQEVLISELCNKLTKLSYSLNKEILGVE
jgi:hypothetical protein